MSAMLPENPTAAHGHGYRRRRRFLADGQIDEAFDVAINLRLLRAVVEETGQRHAAEHFHTVSRGHQLGQAVDHAKIRGSARITRGINGVGCGRVHWLCGSCGRRLKFGHTLIQALGCNTLQESKQKICENR